MKNILIYFTLLVFISVNGFAQSDTIERIDTLRLTRPEPPYETYDTIIRYKKPARRTGSSASQQETIDNKSFRAMNCKINTPPELNIKAEKLRMALLKKQTLPKGIQLTTSNDHGSTYFYRTTRTKSSGIDSASILIIIRDDSLKYIQFSETHFKDGKQGRTYSYTINENNEVIHAYHHEAYASSRPVVEISYAPEYPLADKLDDKVIDLYTTRLKMALEELEKMFSAK